jgi:ribosomal protein L37AE/L43A
LKTYIRNSKPVLLRAGVYYLSTEGVLTPVKLEEGREMSKPKECPECGGIDIKTYKPDGWTVCRDCGNTWTAEI